MADIFVSYARADKERVAPLVAALEAQGYSVWWDPAIAGGQEFDAAITKELESARAAIVVWTEASVSSRWVRGEARMAADRGVLVPVQFGAPSLPLDARALHTIDFDNWTGDAAGAPFQELIRSLKSLDRSAQPPAAAATNRAAPRAAAPPLTPNVAAQTPSEKTWFGLSRKQFIPALAIILGTVVAITGTIVRHGAPWRSAPSATATAPQSGPAVTSSSSQDSNATLTATEAKPRIAILPFENLSPDPNNAFFTDGMHEEILTALANSAPGLEVISRTTMMMYKEHPASIEQIAKDLGCTHVIEGSVRREGDEVRVTLQLINAKTDEHIWAQNYDRKLVKAMALQSEVAGEVAQQLSVKLAPHAQTAAATPTKDPLAYDLYLKARLARQDLGGPSTLQAWQADRALFSQAIAHDPEFVLAYVGRIEVDMWLYTVNAVEGQPVEEARSDLAIVKRLAPDNPSVLGAEALWAVCIDRDFAGAFRLFDTAEPPGLPTPIFLSGRLPR